MEPVNIPDKLSAIDAPWSPRIIASLNGQEVKLARLDGTFVWHKHDDADELFYVLEGTFRMEFRDRSVEISAGQMIVVPRGMEHRPVADKPCSVMLFEPEGVVNTGDAESCAMTNKATPL